MSSPYSNKNRNTYIVVGIILIGVIALFFFADKAGGPTNLSPFASCLKDKGVLFYGAYWCEYCKKKKAMFGTAVKDLPYIECSSPDGQSQLPICVQNKIESYPTWVFKDGTRMSGEIPLKTLAEKSGCELPTETTNN